MVGPDEYKEHVNDNTFTNYMAWWNIRKAVEYSESLKKNNVRLYRRLDEKLDLKRWIVQWEERLDKISLPQPREDGVLPQDSTYLSLQEIDLDNNNPHSSDAGIHAASYGGLWQCAVYGFGGLRMLNGKLRINPSLPDAWDSLSYSILWQGKKLEVTVERDKVTVKNTSGEKPVEAEVCGKIREIRDVLEVERKNGAADLSNI